MSRSHSSQFGRKMRASLRDSWLLLREFQWPLILFAGAILGGGAAYQRLAILAGESVGGLSASAYHVLTLVFLGPVEAFPDTWYLQIFFFMMPILGIGILAQGVADFGVLFFNRRARSKEWEMAVASTFQDHIVLVGLGHLGFRVAHHLHSLGQDVVAIDLQPKADLMRSVQDVGIPVLEDDSTREEALRAAGVDKARAIILCTQQDALNLQVSMKARTLNPDIRVVVRIFDDDFAHALKDQFGFQAISTSATASPIFAATAAGVDMTRPITVEGQALSLASLTVAAQSHLAEQTVAQIEQNYGVSVVLLRRANENPIYHPGPEQKINNGDILAVLGGATEISALADQNEHR